MTDLHQVLKVLKAHKWVILTHDVTPEIPIYHTFNPLSQGIISTLEDGRVDSREYTIGTSHGTHIDAPKHFAAGTRSLEEIPLEERILPLYVIHLEDKVKEIPGYAVTVDDIKAFEAEYGEIPAGSFVAFSSGWYKRFYDSAVFKNVDENGTEHTPGWSIPALEYLSRKRGVTAIGHETLNTDSGVEAAEAGFLDAELYWLAEDKYQVELMANLDQVPSVGSIIFVTVPHIHGAPGFTAEVFAIVPNLD